MKHRVEVNIHGHEYVIRSRRSEAEVQRVAAFVDEKIGAVTAAGATADSLHATILAFMNVAGLYLELHEQSVQAEDAVERIKVLNQKLEAALK
ncbi:MAG: cell division protein ZapA [Desulfuromonadaceae bacterium]|nr:cell division protein ZapA [Desulfuromonadaceae bacterium]